MQHRDAGYVSGGTLAKLLYKKISARATLSWSCCLLLGCLGSRMAVIVHFHGYVHRDVKPANVFFCDMVEIADLGEAAFSTQTGK